MKQLWHVISAIKNFLIVTTGAVISYKIVEQTYDIQATVYLIIGLFGYIGLSFLEEWLKKHD